jgi:hypothetical protein
VVLWLFAGGVAKAETAPRAPGARPAFIERMPPADFLAVEGLSLRRFSATCELVIVKTERGQATYVLTLREHPPGGYLWEAYFLAPGVEPKAATVDINFDPKIAGRYLAALNYRMSRWVTVVEKSHDPAHYDTAWWLYYKVENGAIAGLLDASDLPRNPDAKAFADLFLTAPQRLLVADAEQERAILDEIDAKSGAVIRSESAK